MRNSGPRPVRALWLIKGLGAGGAERLLALSARHRDPGAVAPHVAYLLEHKQALLPEFERAGIDATCLGARASWDPSWVIRLRKLCIRTHFDIVHVHSPIAAIGARLALRTLPARKRPRLVITEHNVWGSHAKTTRLADNMTAHGDETHLAVSNAVRASMPARLRGDTRVIQHGVDLQEVRSAAVDRDVARRSLGVEAHEVLVGTVANLRATKGYPDLLCAARTVVDRVDNVRFVALGQGPMMQELLDRHDQLGLGDRFLFLGYRPDAVRVMSAFDVFCLASHHEGLPIALMEALVLGLPVVATDVGGIAELVTVGRGAILVPAGQPGRLADALTTVVRDPDLRAEMSRTARDIGDSLDALSAVREIEGVYREILDR